MDRVTELVARTKASTVCTSCRLDVTRLFEEWQKTHPARTVDGRRSTVNLFKGLLPTRSFLSRAHLQLRSFLAHSLVKPVTHERFYRTFFIQDGILSTSLGLTRFSHPDMRHSRRPFEIRVRCFNQQGKAVGERLFPFRGDEVRQIGLQSLLPPDFQGWGYVEVRIASNGPSRSFAWLQGTLRPYVTFARKDGLRATVHEKSKPADNLMILPPFTHDSHFSIELILANTTDSEVRGQVCFRNGSAEVVTVPYTLGPYASWRERLTDLVRERPGLWTGYLTADASLVEYILVQSRTGDHFAIQHL
jgi:hypothetical protein